MLRYCGEFDIVYIQKGKWRNVGLSGSNQKAGQIPNECLETKTATDQMSFMHNAQLSMLALPCIELWEFS